MIVGRATTSDVAHDHDVALSVPHGLPAVGLRQRLARERVLLLGSVGQVDPRIPLDAEPVDDMLVEVAEIARQQLALETPDPGPKVRDARAGDEQARDRLVPRHAADLRRLRVLGQVAELVHPLAHLVEREQRVRPLDQLQREAGAEILANARQFNLPDGLPDDLMLLSSGQLKTIQEKVRELQERNRRLEMAGKTYA